MDEEDYTQLRIQERFLVYQLTKMVYEGGKGNFLIINQGPRYLQLMSELGGTTLICEAVSNAYLPPDHILSPIQIQSLEENGFSKPQSADQNFQRVCDLSRPEYFHQLAHFILSILVNVYKCSPKDGWNYEITLE